VNVARLRPSVLDHNPDSPADNVPFPFFDNSASIAAQVTFYVEQTVMWSNCSVSLFLRSKRVQYST
jgi:hypothetical protein